MGEAGPWCCPATTPCAAKRSRSGKRKWEDDVTAAPVYHVLPLATIVRERLLPVKGNVLARAGQSVHSSDIVAEAVWAREHIFLDVARTLNVSPDEADRLIRCKTGDKVPAGAVVATGR